MTEIAVATPRSSRTTNARLPGLDVTRAVALIGVVVMNYHGYLNGGGGPDPSFAERVFDTSDGPLSTRFAATFVLVAGMGVTLLTNRSRISGNRVAIRVDRWRLVRRGLLLYSFGLLIEWVWHGTILVYYGAFFMVAALLFTLRLRWLAAVGVGAALAGAGIALFRVVHALDGHDVRWLDPVVDSPRNLVLRTFVGYTHPLLPWLLFFCVGIALGRFLPYISGLRVPIIAIGLLLFAGTYAINYFGLRAATDDFARTDRNSVIWRNVLSTGPFDRGLLYSFGALGSSLVAFAVISWIADRFPTTPPITLLRHAGQMTLSLYLLHVITFNAFVHWWGWVSDTGLDTALVFALVFWAVAIAVGASWHRFLGVGPLERVYRDFGG